MAQAQVPKPAYIPALEEMPLRNPLKPLELAAKGQLFFPSRDLTIVTRPDFTPLKLVPVIYPLAGISAESVPVELPPFEATVDAAMSADSWRFLVRLNPAGSVAECVALSKGGEPAGAALEAGIPLAVVPGGTLDHFAGELGIESVADVVAAVQGGNGVQITVASAQAGGFNLSGNGTMRKPRPPGWGLFL